AVSQARDAGVLGAVGAAEHHAVLLDAVADQLAAAVLAGRGQGVDRALERIERVLPAGHRHRERLVVVVATDFTGRHRLSSPEGVTRPLTRRGSPLRVRPLTSSPRRSPAAPSLRRPPRPGPAAAGRPSFW